MDRHSSVSSLDRDSHIAIQPGNVVSPEDQQNPFLSKGFPQSTVHNVALGTNDKAEVSDHASLPKKWPREPRTCKERTVWTHVAFIWDFIVSLFPVIFLGRWSSTAEIEEMGSLGTLPSLRIRCPEA